MKKIISVTLGLIMILSMTACGASSDGQAGDGAAGGETINVMIEIDYPDDSNIADVEDVSMQVPEGSTVLDVINEYGKANDVKIELSDKSESAYVTSINGVSEGSASGWVYEVNDEMVMDAADQHIVKAGDEVSWEYTTW